MPTDSPSCFNPDAARDASLAAVLRRVRFRRRTRHTVRAATAVAVLAVVLALPRLRLPNPGNGLAENPMMVRSRPLAAEQRVRSGPSPELRVRTGDGRARLTRVQTDSGAAVSRLAGPEFDQMLAAHEVGFVEVGGLPAFVLTRHEPAPE
jgi:hypothetical protein